VLSRRGVGVPQVEEIESPQKGRRVRKKGRGKACWDSGLLKRVHKNWPRPTAAEGGKGKTFGGKKFQNTKIPRGPALTAGDWRIQDGGTIKTPQVPKKGTWRREGLPETFSSKSSLGRSVRELGNLDVLVKGKTQRSKNYLKKNGIRGQGKEWQVKQKAGRGHSWTSAEVQRVLEG